MKPVLSRIDGFRAPPRASSAASLPDVLSEQNPSIDGGMVRLAAQQVLRLKDIHEYESLLKIAAIQIVHTGVVRGGFARWQIYRAITHIEVHLAESMRLRELAVVTRLSASHFSRAFKTTIGMTPCTFITKKRIARACTLMKTTGESLCQIAIACGLCDQAHLCRTFRLIMGETPRAWRRFNAAGPEELTRPHRSLRNLGPEPEEM
jgi:AraC-like DNA-binding protein